MHHFWTNQPTWLVITSSIYFIHSNQFKWHSFVSTANYTLCDHVTFPIIVRRTDRISHGWADSSSLIEAALQPLKRGALFPIAIGKLWCLRSAQFPFWNIPFSLNFSCEWVSLNVTIAGSPGGWVWSEVDEGDLRFHGLVEESEALVGLIWLGPLGHSFCYLFCCGSSRCLQTCSFIWI